jgi:colanic acid biosynthesis glycosyl transferase WcaI
MRLLLLNQYYPPDTAPTGRMLHDLAQALISRGHAVRVICSQRTYDGSPRRPAREQLDGVEIVRLPAWGFGRQRFVGKLCDYGSFAALLALRLAFNRFCPDMILSMATPPYLGLIARAATCFRRVRHAHWVMDLYPDIMAAHWGTGEKDRGSGFRFLQFCARRTFGGASLVVALGPHMATRVARYVPGGRVEWVPLWGGAELEGGGTEVRGQPSEIRDESSVIGSQASGLKTQDSPALSSLRLMYSGNMGLGHRFGEFLELARRLGKDGPQWVFAGGGKRRGEIEAFAAAHPEARIELRPYAPAGQLQQHLASADVHLASLDPAWQGLMVPSKIQGIFSVGRPVVFVGGMENGIAEWIRNSGGGWCVSPGDVDALAEALRQAAHPEERERRGRAALAFARQHFDRVTNRGRVVEMIEATMRKTN